MVKGFIAEAVKAPKTISTTELVEGSSNADQLIGESNAEEIRAGAGNDLVDAGHGSDVINGNGGDDLIKAGAGIDLDSGDERNDTIDGGAGDDSLIGGDKNDTYIFSTKDGAFGHDTIVDDGNDGVTGVGELKTLAKWGIASVKAGDLGAGLDRQQQIAC